MICEYCGTEHPQDQIANPYWCIEKLAAKNEKLSEENKRLRNYIRDIIAVGGDEWAVHEKCIAALRGDK